VAVTTLSFILAKVSTDQYQGRSDGGYIGIYTPKSVYLKFFVVVLSPWAIYTHRIQIPGYAPDQYEYWIVSNQHVG